MANILDELNKVEEEAVKTDKALISESKALSEYIDLLKRNIDIKKEKSKVMRDATKVDPTANEESYDVEEYFDNILETYDSIAYNYEKAEDTLRKKLAEIVLDSVTRQEAETGKKLPLQDQLDLMTDHMKQFVEIFGTESKEYIQIARAVSSIEKQIAKEREITAKNESDALIAARKDSANDILTYFDKQKAITGQDTPLADQLAFYEQQLQEFVDMFGTESDEYIQILKRVRSIEDAIHNERQRDIEDAFKNADIEQRALQQAAKEKEQAYQSVINGISRVTNVIKNALNHIVNIVRRSINIVKRTITTGFRIVTRLTSTIRRLMQLFGSFGNRVKGVQHNGNILKGTFTELKSKIDLLVGAYNKLFNNDYINSGRKLLQSIQTLNITLGKDLTDNTIKWSKELERAFGISASGLISDLQGINAVLYGMGMNSQGTELAGRNLLAVGQTLAGITGYDLDTVLEKIESGMKGMTQSIDDLGLSVRESEMNAFLKDLKAQGGEFSNIATSFQNLTEQQRVYVRYAALMTQFRHQFDAEDYIRSLDSITGRLMILESRFRSLKATIGDFALQLLDRITIPLATFITFIENKIKALAKLFGIDLEISSGMNKTADGAEKASKNLGDVNNALEDIEQTADKAKGGLDAFDHISNISSSKNSNSSPFDYSKLLAIAPDYAKELEDIAKLQDDWLDEQWRKFKEKIKALLEEIKQKISDWWFGLTGRIINWDIIGDNLKKAWENIKTTFENIKRIIKEIFRITVGLVGMILDDLNFTQLLVDITGLFASISGFVATFLETVEPILFDFYNNYLKKYVVEFGDFLHRKINEWIGYFDGLTDWAKSDQGKKDIEAWFDKLGKFIDELVKKVKGLGVLLKVLFAGEDSLTGPTYTGQNNDHLVSKGDYTVLQEAGIDQRYVGVASSIHNIFADILAIITDIGKELGKWWENEGLDQFKSTLERIDKILSENKENIVSEVSTLADSINKIKEAVLQKILDILEWIAQHPEEVNTALTKISDVIVVLVENIDKVVAAIVALKAALVGLKIASLVGNATKIGDVIGKLFTKAAVDKTVENTVSKAGSSIAGKFIGGIGKGISTGYSTITTQIAGIGGSAGLAIGVASIGTAIADIAMGAKNVKREFDGIGASWNGMLAGIKTGIDTTQITLMAHEAGRNLRENYGLQLKQSNIDAVVRGFEAELRATYNITDEEVKKLSQLFEHDLKDAAGVYMHGIINDTAELEQQTKKTEEALASRKQKQDELKDSTIQYRNELNQTKEVQASADFDTASHMKHMCEMKLKQDDYKKSLEDTKKAETEAANSTKLSNMSLDDRKKRVQELNNENAKYRESKRQNAQATSNTTKTEVNAANSLKNSVNNTNVSVKNLGNSSIVTANKAVRAFSNIKNAVDRVNSSVKLTIQNINRMHNGQNYTWATNSSNINKIGVTRVKSYMGHANGGVPSKGSIFMANENGMPELVSNFGGYTGVANQGMILEAMKAAIGSSVYDAVTTAMRTNNAGGSSKPNIEICRQGMFVGDDNAIRKLAVLLDNTLRSSNGNISNTGFSLT